MNIENADVMTIAEFKALCDDGCIVNSDGTGLYVVDGKEVGNPFDDCVDCRNIDETKGTHVAWYNV